MNYRSFDDLSKTIMKNVSKIPKEIDLIVGVPRSGLLVANQISLLLNKPLTDFEGYFENRLISNGKTKNNVSFISCCKEAKNVLVMEDSVYSGNSILSCKRRIESEKNENVKYYYGAVYVTSEIRNIVDFYFEIVDTPRVFQWNIFHHEIVKFSCFDMDGVLCVDPSEKENDDGLNYQSFLMNATPKIIPTQKIGAIVTSRLLKYENETKAWLDSHAVRYNELIMMNVTFEERRSKGNHAEFKGQFYKRSNYVLFIESDPNQAIRINQISGKPVFCVGDGRFYDGNFRYKIHNESNIKIKIVYALRKFCLGRAMLRIYRRLKHGKLTDNHTRS